LLLLFCYAATTDTILGFSLFHLPDKPPKNPTPILRSFPAAAHFLQNSNQPVPLPINHHHTFSLHHSSPIHKQFISPSPPSHFITMALCHHHRLNLQTYNHRFNSQPWFALTVTTTTSNPKPQTRTNSQPPFHPIQTITVPITNPLPSITMAICSST
jgi:hypothetical protein